MNKLSDAILRKLKATGKAPKIVADGSWPPPLSRVLSCLFHVHPLPNIGLWLAHNSRGAGYTAVEINRLYQAPA